VLLKNLKKVSKHFGSCDVLGYMLIDDVVGVINMLEILFRKLRSCETF
jgi:hypothetical protein